MSIRKLPSVAREFVGREKESTKKTHLNRPKTQG